MKPISESISRIAPAVAIGLFAILFLSVLRTSIFVQTEGENHLFFEISLLLFIALIAKVTVAHLKEPSVMLLLLFGVLVSKSFLALIWPIAVQLVPLLPNNAPIFIPDQRTIQLFGQIGVLFILMRVGLWEKFGKVFNFKNGLVAFCGVVVPFTAGYLYASTTGGSSSYALFLGASLVATSVGLTIAMLKESGFLRARFAEVILGAAVIDDVLGLIVLSLVSVASSSSFDFWVIFQVLVNTLVFFIGGALAGREFIRKVIDTGELDSKKLLIMLSFVFSYAYIAEFIGLSGIVGAFLAGILLNGSKNLPKISEKTEVLELVFAPIFFVSLGMMVDVRALFIFFVPILVITVIAVVTKIIGCGLGSILIGLSRGEVALVGVGMIPRGEVALVVALIGLSRGAISQEQYTIIAAMAFLTAFLTPLIIRPLLSRVKPVHIAGRIR